MKEIHLRRHAEKSSDGGLSTSGVQAAKELSQYLPKFAQVISSNSDRAQLTAHLLTGIDPVIDIRAGMYMATPEKSDAINQLAAAHGLTFLEAIEKYQDKEVIDGTNNRANELNELISELFDKLKENEKALIVSHDLSIIAAMTKKNVLPALISPLEGYILKEDGSIELTK
jgi:broad specificity phosphatase PhoE